MSWSWDHDHFQQKSPALRVPSSVRHPLAPREVSCGRQSWTACRIEPERPIGKSVLHVSSVILCNSELRGTPHHYTGKGGQKHWNLAVTACNGNLESWVVVVSQGIKFQDLNYHMEFGDVSKNRVMKHICFNANDRKDLMPPWIISLTNKLPTIEWEWVYPKKLWEYLANFLTFLPLQLFLTFPDLKYMNSKPWANWNVSDTYIMA